MRDIQYRPGPFFAVGSSQSLTSSAIFDSSAAPGGVVCVPSDGHVDLAKADAFATSVPVGLAVAAVEAGNVGEYVTSGPLTIDDWTAVTGSDSLEPGKIYFLSVDDAGCMGLTTSEVSGTYVVIMGTALDAKTFKVDIHRALVNG